MSNSETPALPAGTSPEGARPRGCTNFLLHQLMRRLDQLYDAELAKAGLKTTQYSLLSNIVRLGPVRPGVLARAMHMQPSTLTRNLRPLQAAGWVEVGEGDDGRSRSVQATDAGRDKQRQAQRHWKAVQLALNHRLGDAQVAALHEQLAGAMAGLASPQPNITAENDHGQ